MKKEIYTVLEHSTCVPGLTHLLGSYKKFNDAAEIMIKAANSYRANYLKYHYADDVCVEDRRHHDLPQASVTVLIDDTKRVIRLYTIEKNCLH